MGVFWQKTDNEPGRRNRKNLLVLLTVAVRDGTAVREFRGRNRMAAGNGFKVRM
jgi:hypothetical protein